MLINAENITSTNFDDQKIRYKMDFCRLHTVLLGLVLLFLIAAIFCHYTKHSAKCIGKLTIYNWRINNIGFKNILVHDNSWGTLMGPKSLCIRFDEIDGLIRVYDGRRYLVLFDPEKYDVIRIVYLTELKSVVTYAFLHNFFLFFYFFFSPQLCKRQS